VENAAGNAGIIEEIEIEKLFPGDKNYLKADNYNAALEKYTAAEKIDLAMKLEKHTLSLDKRVVSVDYCVIGTQENIKRISNSYGMELNDRSNMAFSYVQARVEENGVTKNAFDVWHGNDLADFSYEETAKNAVEKAVSYLTAKSTESGEYPIIFDNKRAIEVMECFSGIFFAENVQKGFSLLKDKCGTEIASEIVTLRDDGNCDKCYYNPSFDSEGVATKNKTVIENGVLKTLLYNLKSAEKDGAESTGNGFKPGLRSSVGTSPTNFYFQPSDVSFDKLLEQAGDGILITELAGLHSGANIISGDFSFSADGYMIENGKIGRPVEQITVAGNFYSMLKNITAIGNDLRFGPPGAGGALGMPSFSVGGLRVSGL
jgi:PmbA protein